MRSTRGYTILELMVAVGIVGALATVSSFTYIYVVPKAQATEAFKLMHAEKAKVLHNIKSGTCANNASGAIGKYGNLTVAGTYNGASVAGCPIGCRLTYTFNTTGVSPQVKSKVVVVDVLNDFSLKRTTATTLAERFINKNFKVYAGSGAGAGTTSCPTNTSSGNTVTPGTGTTGDSNSNQPGNPPGGGTGNPPGGGTGDPPGTGNPPGGGTGDPPNNGGRDDEDGGGGNNPPGGGNNTNPPGNGSTTPDVVTESGLETKYYAPRSSDWIMEHSVTTSDGTTCTSRTPVSTGQHLLRLGGRLETNNSVTFQEAAEPKYYVRHESNLLSEFRTTSRVNPAGQDVRFFVPCGIAVVGALSRTPSVFIPDTTNSELPSRISFYNHGLISGRGGDAGIYQVTDTGFFDQYGGTGYFGFSDHNQNNLTSQNMGQNSRGGVLAAQPNSAVTLYGAVLNEHSGGVGLVNFDDSITLEVQNFGVIQGGGSASRPVRRLVDATTREAIFVGGSGGAPYGTGGSFVAKVDTRHEVIPWCATVNIGINNYCEYPSREDAVTYGVYGQDLASVYPVNFAYLNPANTLTPNPGLNVFQPGRTASFSTGGPRTCSKLVTNFCNLKGRDFGAEGDGRLNYGTTYFEKFVIEKVPKTVNGVSFTANIEKYFNTTEGVNVVITPGATYEMQGNKPREYAYSYYYKINNITMDSDYAYGGKVNVVQAVPTAMVRGKIYNQATSPEALADVNKTTRSSVGRAFHQAYFAIHGRNPN